MRRPIGAVLAAIVLLLSGCAAATDAPAAPPPDAAFDYQLGGGYEPDAAIAVVVRDRTDAPDPDRYSICYVNAFQTQPGEQDDWPSEALLTDEAGDVVIDPDWPDEALLDISDDAAADLVIDRVGNWIRGCGTDGFDAVEFDNLDSFTRSGGAITLDDAVAVARDLVAIAHDAGLAAGQKNAAEHTTVLHDEAGFDFAVAEECAAYDECAAYTDVYESILDIEYTDQLPKPFAELCAQQDTPPTAILRDRDLARPDESGHVYESC
ncbi:MULTISPECIES: endo alpha-1,4 polygalactosaminidase [unclassified Microbacterium]|uniref:endo alpha-1,4 polygalactosaminidase n=1 Tax=unclassified Microbacterium TaxID=2609290 RepID=UPI001DA379DE|nr:MULTISPECIES: endo alpha-1,4 polygalactosaminidase [unclassified Microbacterium]CAH0206857.1 hypothetical protein SRABI121_02624 [Microbacterium sp. Bi121]HWK78914.1 endo alpha-1,4 polygalactosaminidase [Microbacterium sp.]